MAGSAAYTEKNDAAIARIVDELADEDELSDLAELFKIFGDSTRIKILYTLLESELSVNDISKVLSMKQPAISHQLQILKANGLVKFRREGKLSIYSLADSHVKTILSQGMNHIEE